MSLRSTAMSIWPNRILALTLALTSAVGCDRDQAAPVPAPTPTESVAQQGDAAASEQSAPPGAAPPLAPDFPETKLGDIPTSEELEHEAENTVAIQNLEAELDRLEAEIVEAPN